MDTDLIILINLMGLAYLGFGFGLGLKVCVWYMRKNEPKKIVRYEKEYKHLSPDDF